jgi:hypothetical protein
MYSNKYKKEPGEKVVSLLNISDRNCGNVTVASVAANRVVLEALQALLVAKDCFSHVTSHTSENKSLMSQAIRSNFRKESSPKCVISVRRYCPSPDRDVRKMQRMIYNKCK